MESSVQERHWSVGAGKKEGHKNNQRDGTPILWGQTKKVRAVQLGEKKTLGKP